jgi:fatty-acyl-CoA synthase
MSTGLYDGCSMGELLVRAIQRGGDRDAFILDDRRITYRAFGALLSRFIQALEARGLRKGDAVATLSANRPEAFLTTAAAYMMGLRITWMHPLASEDDHAYLLEDSGVTTLFVDPDTFTERAAALKARLPGLRTLYGSAPPPPSSRAGWSPRPRPTTSAS